MQRSRFVNVWRGVFVLALLLATTSTTSAQSITDARRVEFTPSPDHNATDPATGVAIVQSYSLQVFLAGGTTPQQAVSLGKPAPQSDGMIRVDFVALLTTPLTPGLIYETIVSAVGPGGSTASARSNTFAFTAPCTPSISPTSQAVLAGGGTGSSTVSVGTGHRPRHHHVHCGGQRGDDEPHGNPDDRRTQLHRQPGGDAVHSSDFTDVDEPNRRRRQRHGGGHRADRMRLDRHE
jgi:hypothetical protein